MKFEFLPQHSMVEDILSACVVACLRLGGEEARALEKAMRPFENFACPVLWSPNDVDDDGELGLTDAEKASVICKFITSYEIKEADWLQLETISRDEVDYREPT